MSVQNVSEEHWLVKKRNMGGPPVPSKASRTLEEVFKSTKCFLLKKAWLPRRAPRHSQTDPGLPGTVGAIRIACGRGRELLHGKACRARPSPHHRQRVLCVGAGVGINVSALVGPHTSTAVQNPARCARHEGAEEPQPDEAGRCWGGGGDLGGPASPPCGVPSACRSHSRSLYLVNRLYRTLSVDLRSRFTTSSGRALGVLSPPSSISSKANATLWTFWSKLSGVR